MKKRIDYLCLLTLTLFLIFSGCEKEINDISLTETYAKNQSSDAKTQFNGVGTKTHDFPGGNRKYAVSFSIGNKIYLGFGFDNSGALKDFWEWDLSKVNTAQDLTTKNLWAKLPDFPGSFSKNGVTEGTPLGFAVNGKGYILPGAFRDNGNLVYELWEFDPETNSWTKKADPPDTLARYFATGFSVGSKLFVGTGESYYDNEWKIFNDLWEWDQATDTWTKKADFPGAARAHAVGLSIGDKGYIGLGGEIGMGGGPVYQDFWEYNPGTDKWIKKAEFNGVQLIGAIGFSVGNKGYVSVGWDPIYDSTVPQEVWEWNQATDSWTKTGIFAGAVRTGAVGGSIGKTGYLSTGANIGKSWESNPILNDFWLIDFFTD